MAWTIERILSYPEEKPWGQGYAHSGFHDRRGNRYFFDYFHHWVGRLGKDDEFLWTAGVKARCHNRLSNGRGLRSPDVLDGVAGRESAHLL